MYYKSLRPQCYRPVDCIIIAFGCAEPLVRRNTSSTIFNEIPEISCWPYKREGFQASEKVPSESETEYDGNGNASHAQLTSIRPLLRLMNRSGDVKSFAEICERSACA